MCLKLDNLETAVDNVNADTEKLGKGQITIQNYLNTIRDTNTNIQESTEKTIIPVQLQNSSAKRRLLQANTNRDIPKQPAKRFHHNQAIR